MNYTYHFLNNQGIIAADAGTEICRLGEFYLITYEFEINDGIKSTTITYTTINKT